MKNRVSKIVISMLITSFIMPTVADAGVKGRRRSGSSGSDRLINIKRFGSNDIYKLKDENKKDDASITKEEYDLPENKVKYLSSLRLNVFQAKDKAIKQCEGISDAVSKIFSLSTTSSIMSAAGTGMAATGLVTGLMKKNKQDVANAVKDYGVRSDAEKIAREKLPEEKRHELEGKESFVRAAKEEQDKAFAEHKQIGEEIKRRRNEGATEEEIKELLGAQKEVLNRAQGPLADTVIARESELEKYKKEIGLLEEEGSVVNTNQDLIDKNLKTAKTLGHIRTGMMAGASATSLISMGTSIGASVDSGKLSEKMTACNNAINELRTASNKLNAEIKDAQYLLKEKLGDNYEEKKPEYMKQAEKIHKISLDMIAGCKKYETKDISYVKNLMTASSVVSGIGTATAITGAITSGLANTKKAKGDRKYEKNMDLTANIMAGVTAGTSLTSTGLSGAASVATGKKLQQQAKDCEAALNNDLFVDLSKEVDAITKKQAEIEEERNKKIKDMR